MSRDSRATGGKKKVRIIEPIEEVDEDGYLSDPPTARARASPSSSDRSNEVKRGPSGLSRSESFDRRREAQQTTSMTHQALSAAIAENNESIRTINHAMKEVASSEQLGEQASTALEVQREQIDEIDANLRRMPNQFRRARNEMITIARRLARDKCFLVLAALVLVVVILIVSGAVVKVAKPGFLGGSSSPITVIIPTPEPTTRSPR